MVSIISLKNISIMLAAIIVIFLIRILAILSLETMSVILVIIIIAFLIWILISMNRELKKNIIIEKKKTEIYEIELKRIKEIKDVNKGVEEINKLARDFFKKRLDLKESLTYLELAKEFKKGKKEKHEEFCLLIANLMYSGIAIEKEDTQKLIKLFTSIINTK